jgi:hypothetical protein
MSSAVRPSHKLKCGSVSCNWSVRLLLKLLFHQSAWVLLCRVQFWVYSPPVLSHKGSVDPACYHCTLFVLLFYNSVNTREKEWYPRVLDPHNLSLKSSVSIYQQLELALTLRLAVHAQAARSCKLPSQNKPCPPAALLPLRWERCRLGSTLESTDSVVNKVAT